jgi:hypothetical protein
VVMFCPNLAGRDRMLAAGTTDYATLLGTKKGLRAVTPWLIWQNVLPQFSVAREMVADVGAGGSPLQHVYISRFLPQKHSIACVGPRGSVSGGK